MPIWKVSSLVPLILSFVIVSTALAQTPASTPPLTLGLYLVIPCQFPNASTPMQLARKSEQDCLNPNPVIDQTDVASAAFYNARDGQPGIN